MRDTPTPDFLALQEALVGRYSIQHEIGRGGMGIVYLAHDVALDRPVALKLLPPEFAAQPALRERFIREARTAAKLSQPNIVPIHAVEEAGDFVFFVMSYVEGDTLGERVRTRGPLSPTEGARVLREVAWALAYAHAHGVVHRDVKPDNVLLEADTGRALIMDFGIAQVSEGPGLTSVGEILGTAEFMSPEQASGEDVDERSDVYSVGVLAHYVLSGRLPFQGSTVTATLAQHLTQPAPPLATVVPEVPTALAEAVDRCLAKDPADRFPDGEKLAEALSRTLGERRAIPVPVRTFMEQTRDRFKGMAAWIIIILYMLGGSAMLIAEGLPELGLLAAVFGLLMGLTPLTMLGRMTRELLRSGYNQDDLVRALGEDLKRRREEFAYELAAQRSWIGALGKGLVVGGLVAMTAGTMASAFLDMTAMSWTAITALGGLMVGGLVASVIGMPLAVTRLGHGRRAPGERALKFWKSRVAGWLFGASGVGLAPALTGGAAYRPTEVLIGTAADRLFKELPKEVKRELGGLPDVIRTLEADGQRMRKHVADMDRLLSEVGDEPNRVGAEERARLAADLEATRDEAQSRMTDAVSALETIRLGLLRLHAGEDTVQHLTRQLGSARDISADIERLISGQVEVARLLGEGDTGSDA